MSPVFDESSGESAIMKWHQEGKLWKSSPGTGRGSQLRGFSGQAGNSSVPA